MTNFTAKTFFIVIWDKSLENMGIDANWNKPKEISEMLMDTIHEIDAGGCGTICKSKEGKYHIHAAVTFKKPKRLKAVAKELGNCHVEEQKGTKAEALNYIRKKGKWEDKEEEVLLEFGSEEEVEDKSGKRTDLKEFDKMILEEGNKLNQYILDHAKTDAQIRYFEKRAHRVWEENQEPWREVEVTYVEGKAGSGKTRGALERYPDAFKISVDSRTSFPFDGYMGERVLILDELRPEVLTHEFLMQILDGYKMNVNVKGSHIPARWNKVIITTAFPLENWYKNERKWEEKDDKYEQLKRRIHHHKIAINNVWTEYSSSYDLTPIKTEDIEKINTIFEND